MNGIGWKMSLDNLHKVASHSSGQKVAKKTLRVYHDVAQKTVKDVDQQRVRPQRGGVLVYTEIDGKKYYGFGMDSKYHELTDFGGHIKYKWDKTVISGALREFHEESLGVFGSFSIGDSLIQDSHCIYDNHLFIIFLKVTVPSLEEINERFEERLKNTKDPEVCKIVWLSEEKLLKEIDCQSRILYSNVKDVLEMGKGFTEYLA